MTRQEFNDYLDELTSETGFDLTKEQKAFAYQAAKKYHEQALRIHDVVGQSEQLTAFAEYCDEEHGLFIPSWMIDGYNKSR